MILNLIIELFLFLPGIFLIDFISEKIRLNLSLLERIIDGAILWNYFFSLSALIGLIPRVLKLFFLIYLGISVAVFLLLITRYLVKHTKKGRAIVFKMDFNNVPLLLFFILYLSVVAIIAVNAPISGSWDLWAVWLPGAKSIYERGDLIFNEYLYFPIKMWIADPPFIPLLNAYILAIAGGYARLYPFIYYVLLGCLTYEISKTLTHDLRIAYGSFIGVMTSILIISTLFGYTLHPEIVTTFFFYASVFYIFNFTQNCSKSYYGLMSSFSLSLLFWTRQFGIILGYFILLLMIPLLPKFGKLKKLLFLILYLCPLLYLGRTFFREMVIPLTIYFCIISILIHRLSVANSSEGSVRHIVSYLIIGLLPCVIFFLVSGYFSGLWFYTFQANPEIRATYLQFLEFASIAEAQNVSFISLLQLSDIFLRLFFIQFTIPFVIGFSVLVKKRSLNDQLPVLLIIFFLSLFLIRYQDFYPSLSPPDYAFTRRLTYLIPLISHISSAGLCSFFKLFCAPHKRSLAYGILPSLIYFPLSTVYILDKAKSSWTKPLTSLSNLWGLRVPISDFASGIDILWMVTLVLASFGSVHILASLERFTRRIKKRVLSITLLVMMVFSLVSFSFFFSLLYHPLSESINKGEELRLKPPSWAMDVVNYFKNNHCKGFVMGWRIYYLPTYSNEKIIDLSLYRGYIVLNSILRSHDVYDALSEMEELNIKCIVIPKIQDTREYALFVKYTREFPILKKIISSQNVTCTEISTKNRVCLLR